MSSQEHQKHGRARLQTRSKPASSGEQRGPQERPYWRAQESPGDHRTSQESPDREHIMRTQKSTGKHRRAQRNPKGPRRTQKSTGEPRRAQERPGEPRRAQESRGEGRERPGEARKASQEHRTAGERTGAHHIYCRRAHWTAEEHTRAHRSAGPQESTRLARYIYHFQTHRCDSYKDCSIKMQNAYSIHSTTTPGPSNLTTLHDFAVQVAQNAKRLLAKTKF